MSGPVAGEAQLSSALDRLTSGHGTAIFALRRPSDVGPGQWIRAQVGDSACLVLEGHAPVAGPCPDYAPIAEALSSPGRDGAIDPSVFGGSDGPLAGLVLDAGVAPASREPSVPMVCEAVLRALRALGGGRGLVLLLEDIHLADDKSLAVVDYLEANVDRVPLLLACTADHEARGSALRLIERARPGRIMLAEATGAGRGETVSERCRQVLQALAAIGSANDIAVLAGAAGVTEARARTALQEARSAGVLSESGGVTPDLLPVDPAMAGDTLAAMLPADRVQLAKRALAAVEAVHPQLTHPWRERAARLCLLAGDTAAGSRHLIEAAKDAARCGTVDDALDLLDEARGLRADGPAGVDLLEAELVVELAAGRSARAVAAGEALVNALTTVGANEARLDAARVALATARHRRGLGASVGRDADPQVGSCGSLQLRRDLLEAQRQAWRAETTAAADTARRIAAAATGFDPMLELDALELLGRTLVGTDGRAAVSAFERARIVAQRAGLAIPASEARLRAAGLQAAASLDPSELLAAFRAAVATGSPGLVAEGGYRLGVVLLLLDRGPDARTHLTRAVDAARASESWHLPFALTFLAACHARDGAAGAAESLLAEAEQLSDSRPDASATVLGEGRAVVSLASGAIAAARDDLARAAQAAVKGQPMFWPFLGLHRLLEAAGGNADACDASPAIASWTRLFRGCDAMAAAITAGRAGDARAAEHAADGLAYLAPAPWYHHLAILLAAPHALRDGWGTPEQWLRGALAFFEATNRPPLATRCRTALASSGLVVPRRGRGARPVPEPLAVIGITSRELDVIELVSAGRSNAEVAEELVLSLHTVKSHLAHVFQKTGIRYRSQLADRIDELTRCYQQPLNVRSIERTERSTDVLVSPGSAHDSALPYRT